MRQIHLTVIMRGNKYQSTREDTIIPGMKTNIRIAG